MNHVRMMIETQNLTLIPCTATLLKAAIAGDEYLAAQLNVKVNSQWSEFGVNPLLYVLNQLTGTGNEELWWTYFPVHKQDNTLIGSCGYKGQPTADGVVELGYEIAPAYRNRGLATEMARALISNAFKDPRVNSIIAHTLGDENHSTRILTACGFIRTEDVADPEHGYIWKWELKKEST